ncbi:FUSC family protein [Undibacterium terreum]|uniref:Multidrug transporter subunit MdtO n=1 Tax=Undibacterium terreum TaxID=1224302 RepID=A0A916USC0_9BURK|nr:FUSC family protein [Undibacterium terreum]GGC85965.1 multidrug transporter subunit MdtO [Undibacterium terreum]
MPSMTSSFVSLGTVIHKELAPVPGRFTTLWRYLIASGIVIVISMALRVPFIALSIIAIFSTTQQNTYLTRLSGLVATVGLTLAVACSLLLLRLTFDVHLLRIFGAMFILLCAMYFLRTSKLGAIGFLVGLAVIYIQSEVDIAPNPELLVRAVLWVWVAISYPIVVNVLVGYLLPASADSHLHKELKFQLENITHRLKGEQNSSVDMEETFLRMRRQLSYALMAHPKLADHNARCQARVRLVERLLVAIRQISNAGPPELNLDYLRHASIILAAISELQYRLVDGGAFRMVPVPPNYSVVAPAPLAAMCRAFLKLVQEEVPREALESPTTNAKAAAFSLNTLALQFALKVVFATQLGYLFFTAVQWPGIHTCMLTCIILALPGLGAVTHKGVMRLIGAAFGSAAALLATVFVIPHLDSITGLLLLSLAIIAVGAWIAAGSPLTDYVGFQLVFCFALALLGNFGPSTDLTEIRDRSVGIVVGVIISLTIYSWIWPEREGAQVRSVVAELLRALSRVVETCGAADKDEYEIAQVDAWSVVVRLRQFQGRLAFEPTGGSEDSIEWPFERVLSSARQILWDFDWLNMLREDGHSSISGQIEALDAASKAASDRLRSMAAFVATIPPALSPPLNEYMPTAFSAHDTVAVLSSINHQLMQLEQCLLQRHSTGQSKP